MEEKKFYGMKNDYMFKAVLQSAEGVLPNLISVLLGIDESDIEVCDIKNTIELGKSIDSKECVLDVKLVLNNKEIIDLEIQVRDEHNWPQRSLLYWSRAYDSIKSGEDYDKLKRTYHIGILDFTLFKENPAFYSEYMVMDTESGYIYSDKLNIRILDLTQRETYCVRRRDKHKSDAGQVGKDISCQNNGRTRNAIPGRGGTQKNGFTVEGIE